MARFKDFPVGNKRDGIFMCSEYHAGMRRVEPVIVPGDDLKAYAKAYARYSVAALKFEFGYKLPASKKALAEDTQRVAEMTRELTKLKKTLAAVKREVRSRRIAIDRAERYYAARTAVSTQTIERGEAA